MAKIVMVCLREDTIWEEVEVANFYDPERHHTVRLKGSTEKLSYVAMKMEDGRIYDKLKGGWRMIVPETSSITLSYKTELPLPYEENSVGKIVLLTVLERCDDIIALMKEVHRVLTPLGRVEINLPYAPSHLAFSDPETKNYFNESTLRHFAKGNRYDLFSNYQCTVRGEVMNITLKK